MKFLRLFVAVFAVWLAQIACGVAVSYSDATPIPNDVQIPPLVMYGDQYSFIIVTEPDIACYAGIAFWDKNDLWVFDELSRKKSDDAGKCEWQWEVPPNAKNGFGEFRGSVENDKQSTGLIPKKLCIERCPLNLLLFSSFA